jgi:hypothetical protein
MQTYVCPHCVVIVPPNQYVLSQTFTHKACGTELVPFGIFMRMHAYAACSLFCALVGLLFALGYLAARWMPQWWFLPAWASTLMALLIVAWTLAITLSRMFRIKR